MYNYAQWCPPPELTPWIECVWSLTGLSSPSGNLILPDGRLEMVFHFGTPPLTEGKTQCRSLLAGATTKALELRTSGVLDCVGIRLRPEAAGSFVPVHLIAAEEPMEPLLGRWASDLLERLGNTGNPGHRLNLIWEALHARKLPQPDRMVQHFVQAIERRGGSALMSSLIPARTGKRQWQRRFLQTTGFTAKSFSRLARIQRVVQLAPLHTNLANLALEAGYYDQSHFIHDFSSCTGRTPQQYFETKAGLDVFYRDAFLQDEGCMHH